MPPVTIDVARDFTTMPGGRYRADGAFSGEESREVHLAPAIRAGESVVVDLDGTQGFAASFLEEVFGGLARDVGIERA